MLLFCTKFFGFVSTGCIHNAELRKSFSMVETVILQTDREKTFQVSQDDVVLIRLEENPTTGYRWEVDAVDDRVVELQNSNYSMATESGVGGGGVRTFTFKAKSPGTGSIRLKLRRAWESEDAATNHFAVTICVLEE